MTNILDELKFKKEATLEIGPVTFYKEIYCPNKKGIVGSEAFFLLLKTVRRLEKLEEVARAAKKFDKTYLPCDGFNDNELDKFDLKMVPLREALAKLEGK